MKILVACEMSGAVRSLARAADHDAWSLDLLPAIDSSEFHRVEPLTSKVLSEGWDLVIGFPPCTDLAASGARWWPEKIADGRQGSALAFVRMIADAPVARIAIENPVGALSRLWRKPDQIIQPWQFGHGEVKTTCLWLRGLPKLHSTNVVEGREQRVWRMPPSKDRAMLRSLTYPGIAKAMIDQWC